METNFSTLLACGLPSSYTYPLAEGKPSSSYAACSAAGASVQTLGRRITGTAQLSLSWLPPVYPPEAVPRPERTSVVDPATHLPSHMVEVVRGENGKFKSNFPQSWQDLGPLVYMWVSEDEKILIGSSVDFEGRFAAYLTAFRGKGNSSHLSLPQAVQTGMRVWVGIAMVCSSTITMKQNETSLIAQKRLAGYALHNVTAGEGDPAILLGSPTADGRGGEIPSKLASRPPIVIDRTRPIRNISSWSPKRYIPVTLNEAGDINICLPESWKQVSSCIYVFKVQGKRIIGETGRPIRKRVSEYKSSFNGTGPSSNLPLPKAVRTALEKGRRVSFSIIGVCSPVATLRKQFESYFIVSKRSLMSGKGYNQRLETSPSLPPRRLYQVPSPSPQKNKRNPPSFSHAAAGSSKARHIAGTTSDSENDRPMGQRQPLMPIGSGARTRVTRNKFVARTLDFESSTAQAAPFTTLPEQAFNPKDLPWYDQENLISGHNGLI